MVKKKNTQRRQKIDNTFDTNKTKELKSDNFEKNDYNVKGLHNNGNTCYFNAAVQIFLNCPNFIKELESYCSVNHLIYHTYMGINYTFNLNIEYVSDVEMALITLHRVPGKSASAMPLRSALIKHSSFNTYFGNFSQHDSHEVFLIMLDIIKEAQIRRIQCSIRDYFSGRSNSKIISTEQQKLMISLSKQLENQTFIDHYFGMSIGSFYTCKNCDVPRCVFSSHFYISPDFEKVKNVVHEGVTNRDDSDDDIGVLTVSQESSNQKISKHQLKRMRRMAKKESRRKKKNAQNKKDEHEYDNVGDEENEIQYSNENEDVIIEKLESINLKDVEQEDSEQIVDLNTTNDGSLENDKNVDSMIHIDAITKRVADILIIESENEQCEETKGDLCETYNIEYEVLPKDSGKGTSEDTASSLNKQFVNDEDENDYHSMDKDDSYSDCSDNESDVKLTKDALDEAKESLMSYFCSLGIVKTYNSNKSDLELALELFSTPGHRDGLSCESNRCRSNKKKSKSVLTPHAHQDLVLRAPRVLPIYISRMKNNKNGRFGTSITKIQKFYSFPTILNLTEQCSKLIVSSGKGTSQSVTYKLCGLIKHIGNQRNSGHYVSYVNTSIINTAPIDSKYPLNMSKHIANNTNKPLSLQEFGNDVGIENKGATDSNTDQWVLLDDSSISKVPLTNVLKQQAFMIFYYRCQ